MPYQPIETPQDFIDRVQLGSESPAQEDLYLEFKGKYHYDADDKAKRRAEAREAARDITQFSNTEGGTLLWGVTEKTDPQTKIVTASGFCPIANADAAVKWLVAAIETYIYPATPQPTVTTIDIDGHQVIALNVVPAIELQGVWNRSKPTDGMEFLYRNNNKKAQMTMDEVALRMGSASRGKRLRLAQLVERARALRGECKVIIFHPQRVSDGVRLKQANGRYPIAEIEDDQFTLATSKDGMDLQLAIPFEYVAAMWWDHHRRSPVLQLTATVDPDSLTPFWR